MREIAAMLWIFMLVAIPCPAQDLELVREIGVVEGPPEYTFFRISDLTIGQGGEILVLDGGAKAITIYDSTGTFVRRFGREGGGPGEFVEPIRVRVDSGDILVFDWRNARVTRFDTTGSVLKTAPYPQVAGLGLSQLYPLVDGGMLGVSLFRASLGSARHDPWIRVVHVREEQVDTLLSMERGTVIWHGPEGLPWGLAPRQLGYTGAVAVSGDSMVALVDARSSRVRVMRFKREGIASVEQLSIPVRTRSVDASTLAQVEEDIREEFNELPSRLELIAPSAVSDLTGRAFFDDQGFVWIETQARGENSPRRWVVVADAAARVRWLSVPDQFKVMLVSGRRAYGVWRDEWDVETVRVYRLNW